MITRRSFVKGLRRLWRQAPALAAMPRKVPAESVSDIEAEILKDSADVLARIQLDQWARVIGVRRAPRETDDHLRARLLETFKKPSRRTRTQRRPDE